LSTFDDGVDALGIAEEHAERVLSLEEEQEQRLVAVYRKVAANLRARLRSYPKDTFTAQRMRSVLLQLEAAIRAFEQDLSDTAKLGAQLMAERGTRDLVRELNKHNDYFHGTMAHLDVEQHLAATEMTKRLINNYDVSIKTYSTALRHSISTQLQNLFIEGISPEEIHTRMIERDGIANFFEGEAWRLRRIVRTELHGIYGQGKLSTLADIAETEPALRKTLFHPKDSRTADDSLYAESLNLRPKVTDPFVYVWQEKKGGKRYRRVFMSPPDRPNDRAILIPYHPSWDE
jgi:hypothetical protein